MTTPMLEPNRKHLEAFVDVIFRHAAEGYVSVRSFTEGDGTTKFRCVAALVNDRAFFLDAVEAEARIAAQNPTPVVFCPPLCTFNNKDSAKELDIVEGLCITAELDKDPQQARQKLIAILGIPTAEVQSGGLWKNEASGKVENKLHLHWRLSKPATGADELAKLKRARSLASRLVGGDTSADPACHPIRWPGSWHRKASPRPCKIITRNPDVEIGLDTALGALIEAAAKVSISETQRSAAPRSRVSDNRGADDWAQLIGSIIKGADLHISTRGLAAKLVTIGVDGGAAVNLIRGVMQCSNADRDDRYRARYGKIPNLVRSAEQKFHTTDTEKVQRILNAVARAGGNTALFSKAERAIHHLISIREVGDVVGEQALKALSIIRQRLQGIRS